MLRRYYWKVGTNWWTTISSDPQNVHMYETFSTNELHLIHPSEVPDAIWLWIQATLPNAGLYAVVHTEVYVDA